MTPASWIRGENIVTSIWYRLGAEYDTGGCVSARALRFMRPGNRLFGRLGSRSVKCPVGGRTIWES